MTKIDKKFIIAIDGCAATGKSVLAKGIAEKLNILYIDTGAMYRAAGYYFVTNNIAVSRSHADIITRGTLYFVMDLNSKNHTYINNQEIPIHCEVEIHDGDRLKLGNEEFVFNA